MLFGQSKLLFDMGPSFCLGIGGGGAPPGCYLQLWFQCFCQMLFGSCCRGSVNYILTYLGWWGGSGFLEVCREFLINTTFGLGIKIQNIFPTPNLK